MSLKSIAIILMLQAASLSVLASEACQDLFTDPSKQVSQQGEKKESLYQQSKYRYERIVKGGVLNYMLDSLGFLLKINEIKYIRIVARPEKGPWDSQQFVTTFLSTSKLTKDQIKDMNPENVYWAAKRGMNPGLYENAFVSNVRNSIEFVIENYKKRRDWIVDFLNKLRDQAFVDAERSTYIATATWNGETNQKDIVGAMKIIKATAYKNEKLPVDINLGVDVDYNGGLKFEIGNFAVSKIYNKEVLPDILIQLVMHAKKLIKRQKHEKNKMIYFTYGDPISTRMYMALGFKPLAELGTKTINETEWTPLGISAEDILKMPETILKSRSYWENSDMKEILDIVDEITPFVKSDDSIYIAPDSHYDGGIGE